MLGELLALLGAGLGEGALAGGRAGGLAGLLALLAGLLAQRAPVFGVAVRVELHGLVAQLEFVGGLEWRHDLAHELLGGVELVCVVLGHEGERPAGLARAARAPDAVDVVLGVHGHVEVHDVAHVGDVDAAGEDVGGNEDVTAAVAEGAQGALALVLAAVAVDGGAGDVGAAQAAAAGVRAVLRAAEDDDALGALLLEYLGKQRVLGLERDGQRKLVDGLGNRALVRDLHDGRIAHEVADAADGVLVERGREQQRLARGRRLAHDLAHGGQKAHVEHAVRLVEYEHLDVIEVGLALLDEVNEAAGRGNEDVKATAKGGLLRLVAHAAHDGVAAMMRAAFDGGADVGDLLGKLARGRHDEHLGAAVALGVPEAAHRGKQEGGRLARAGLGGGEQVTALEDVGDGLGLDGRGLLVAERLDGLEDGLGKTEVGEGDGHAVAGVGALGHVRCSYLWACAHAAEGPRSRLQTYRWSIRCYHCSRSVLKPPPGRGTLCANCG